MKVIPGPGPFKILNKQVLGAQIKRLDVLAPSVAAKFKPGQFVVIMPDEYAKRWALPIVEADARRGVVTLIFKEDHPCAVRLGALPIGAALYALLGPLGRPSSLANLGKATVVVCVGYEMGLVAMLPICRMLRALGHKVIVAAGARTKKTLVLESQLRLCSQKNYVLTEDGSYERRGQMVDLLARIFDEEKPRLAYLSMPLKMMHQGVLVSQKRKIKTLVNVCPAILDGTGQCGACRVRVGAEEVFACSEGPEFDGDEMDILGLEQRLAFYERAGVSAHPAFAAAAPAPVGWVQFLKNWIKK